MSELLKASLASLLDRRSLDRAQAAAALAALIDGPAPAEQVAVFLTALRMKGETTAEIAGFVDCLNGRAVSVPVARDDLIDVCGTGGDRSGTFNVSTTSSFVVAAAGLAVAKHGNRSVSSRSGSFDLLEALGIGFHTDPAAVGKALDEFGIAFLFAPAFHPALKQIAAIRRNLGVSTVFNVIGPLLNPVQPLTRQVVGVFSPNLVESMVDVLKARGLTEAMVVHGSDGLDELSLAAPTFVARLRDGRVERFEVAPEDFGLRRAPLTSLKGGEPVENAAILMEIFKGAPGPRRDVVLMNAAAALVTGGRAADFREGVERAAAAIDSGAALALVEAMRSASATPNGMSGS